MEWVLFTIDIIFDLKGMLVLKHKNDWSKLLKIGVVILGSLFALISVYVSLYVIHGGVIPQRDLFEFLRNDIWIMLGFILINMLFGTYIFYNKSLLDLLYLTILTQLVLSIFLVVIADIKNDVVISKNVIFLNFLIGIIILFVFNAFMFKMYQYVRGQKRIMVVGEEQRVLEAVKNFELMKNRRHLVSHVVLKNYYYNVCQYCDEVDIVYATGYIEESERLKIYEFLMQNNKKLFISTSFENLMMVNPNIMNFEDESIIEVSSFEIPVEEGIVKRVIDIIVSLFILLLTLPIMVVAAIAIKMDSSGPILYKQERITKNNKRFNILKFRSMRPTAEDQTGPVLASSNDSRVTKVGKFIRATRIDELPQLLNVLKGDMSLVGPRPERPFFVEQFKEQNPYYSLRHHVRAGITGYAQVYGKYSTDFNNKLNFDLLYIKNYSLAFDAKLLFQTIKILFDKVSSRGLDDLKGQEFSWEDFDHVTVIR